MGTKSADKFKQQVYKVLNSIAMHPYMYKSTTFDENARQGFITKQSSVFYQVSDNYIEIIFFWDNRQDPVFKNE